MSEMGLEQKTKPFSIPPRGVVAGCRLNPPLAEFAIRP